MAVARTPNPQSRGIVTHRLCQKGIKMIPEEVAQIRDLLLEEMSKDGGKQSDEDWAFDVAYKIYNKVIDAR